MSPIPKIFISSTTRDLGSYRKAVSDVVLTLGAHPILQDHFPPDSRSVELMLRSKIADCHAVICLVGSVYGQEPRTYGDQQPRRSYTQLEHDVAVELGKPVFSFFATDDCPVDNPSDEPDDVCALQREYIRRLIQVDGPREPFRSLHDLTSRVSLLRFDPESLRGLTTKLAVVLIAELLNGAQQRRQSGDESWVRDVLQPYNTLLGDALTKCKGTVQSEGPTECLANFDSVRDAVEAALFIHEAVRSRDWCNNQPGVRVGINMGQIMRFGGVDETRVIQVSQTVDLCRKLASLGTDGQTLLTRVAFDDARKSVRHSPTGGASASSELSWLSHGRYILCESGEALEVCEVGIVGQSLLIAPPDVPALALRADSLEEQQMRGWRPSIGQAIPRKTDWIIEEKLGEGGFGEVWLACHYRLKERRVFKFCFDAERLRSFKRELAFFKLIQKHLGNREDIARLRDVNVDEPPYYLESDYVDTGDLQTWAARQGGLDRVPLKDRMQFMVRVAEAVAAAHSLGIIHKDLKPSNIFVFEQDGTLRPRLADFGIGVLSDRSFLDRHPMTETDVFKSLVGGNDSSRTGTRMYSPPESQTGKPATTAGDVYALGVILYQLVSGNLTRPLGTGWEEEVSDELLREDIAACTHHDPARRVASAAQLAERLRSLDSRRTALTGHRRTELGAARMHRVRFALIISTAALAVVGGVGFFLSHRWQQAAEENARMVTNLKQIVERNAIEARSIAEAHGDLLREYERIGDANRRLDETEAALRFYERGLEFVRKWAQTHPHDAESQRDLAKSYDRLGDVRLQIGQPNAALKDYQNCLEIRLKLAEANPHNIPAQRAPSFSHIDIGNAELELGQTDAALRSYEDALKITRKLALADPSESNVQRDLAVAFQSLGNVKLRLNETEAALQYYQDRLEIFRKLADADPQNNVAQSDVSISHIFIGDAKLKFNQIDGALQSYEDALTICRKLVHAAPTDSHLQGVLSVALNGLGQAKLRLDDNEAALQYFEDALGICLKLASAHPKDADAQRDLAMLYERIADLTLQIGHADAALEHYRECLEICRKLADATPQDAKAQRNLMVSCGKIGSAKRQLGDTEAALKHYQDDLAIARKLADARPQDVDAQDDLAISYEQLGDTMLEMGQAEEALQNYQQRLEIRRRLVDASPEDMVAQRGLSSSLMDIGNANWQLGQADATCESYEEALKITRKLAAAHPANSNIQRDLMVSFDRLGDVKVDLKQIDVGLQYYQDSLEIRRKMADADPQGANGQRDLAISCQKIGSMRRLRFEYDAAKSYYVEAIHALERLPENGLAKVQVERALKIIRSRFGLCEYASVAVAGLEQIDAAAPEVRAALLFIRCAELARRGELTAVAEAAAKLRLLANQNANRLYCAACGFSLCVRIIDTPPILGIFPENANPRELSLEEQTNRQTYVELALSALESAIDAGWDNPEQIRLDSDFTPLRPLPEFQKLLRSLSSESKTEAIEAGKPEAER